MNQNRRKFVIIQDNVLNIDEIVSVSPIEEGEFIIHIKNNRSMCISGDNVEKDRELFISTIME